MPKEIRIACIVALVQNAKASRIGKTQLQKLVYFLQNAGVPLDYRYEIYHYGPYSFELSDEMGSLDSLGILNVESDPSGFGFNITSGKFAEKYQIGKKYQRKLEKVLVDFSSDTPAQLEVKATIHFVQKIMEKRGSIDQSKVTKKVKLLKPQFSDKFVKNCYSELKQACWIQ